MRKEWLLFTGVLLHWTQANSFELVVRQNHGRQQEGETHICAPLHGNWDEEPKFSRKVDVSFYLQLWHTAQDPGSLFMSHALVNGELAVHSCLLLCLQRQVAKFARGLFYCWSSLCNNNMATNLMFTSCCDIRRFSACDCWTQASWQVVQRDSDCW